MRKFSEVAPEFKKFPDVETKLPTRATAQSAGYDFCSKEEYTIMPGCRHVFWTDVKAEMFFDNYLAIFTRSGNGCKRGIVLANSVGVIDSDYCGNPDNDGNIGICLVNTSDELFKVNIGDRIAQGIFERYLITDDDVYRFESGKSETSSRNGGFGSTGV